MDCVKLEGATDSCISRVRAINDAGMLVMGHIGLTPQFGAQMGGNRAQGKSCDAALQLVKAAKKLEEAGACSILVEGVPAVVGKAITEQANIPILGIGAGSYTDGQLLIYADMVGYFDDFTPKFVKRYGDVGGELLRSFTAYAEEVRSGKFPVDAEHAYKIDPAEAEALEKALKN